MLCSLLQRGAVSLTEIGSEELHRAEQLRLMVVPPPELIKPSPKQILDPFLDDGTLERSHIPVSIIYIFLLVFPSIS